MNVADLGEHLLLKNSTFLQLWLKKRLMIFQSGANLLLGGDCGCLLNISGAMKHSGNKTAHQHIAEFIWERTTDNKS